MGHDGHGAREGPRGIPAAAGPIHTRPSQRCRRRLPRTALDVLPDLRGERLRARVRVAELGGRREHDVARERGGEDEEGLGEHAHLRGRGDAGSRDQRRSAEISGGQREQARLGEGPRRGGRQHEKVRASPPVREGTGGRGYWRAGAARPDHGAADSEWVSERLEPPRRPLQAQAAASKRPVLVDTQRRFVYMKKA